MCVGVCVCVCVCVCVFVCMCVCACARACGSGVPLSSSSGQVDDLEEHALSSVDLSVALKTMEESNGNFNTITLITQLLVTS